MTEHRFGRAGGPTTQMIRETADITVSSLQTSALAAGASLTVLGDPSSITGVAGSHYLIWGFHIGTANSGASYGYLESSDGSEDIAPFAVTQAGPQFLSLNLPIRLEADLGVRLRTLSNINAANKTVLASVHFTVHKP